VSTASVLVRRASTADLDDLLALYEELAGGKLTAAPGDRAGAEPVLAEILADPRRELTVAELDGRIVGTADLVLVPNLSHHGEPWAIVENVVVAVNARRNGVGRALMAYLIERARDAGCCKLQLLSGKHRAGAHRLYRAVGLEAVAEGFKIYFDE
jgi:GNAT superfamily N-acetyltransferase